MRLIIDARNLRLREMVDDGKTLIIHDDSVELDRIRIRDLNASNTIIMPIMDAVPPGMTFDDVPSFKRYNWHYHPPTKQFVKV